MYIYKRLLQGGSFLINQVAVVLLIVLIILPPASTFALSSCTATVSPNTADAGSSATATFVITNNDNTANINWFHIQRPSEYFWISGVSDSAWTVAGDSSQLYFSGDTLAQGQSASIDISFTTDVQNVSAQNWGIEASDTGDATASVPCDGAHLTNVVGNPVNNTDNGVSGVFGQGNGTTAVITWNSDYPTSSYVYYGTTSSYGSVSDFDPTQVQDHSVTLTGLAPSTGYHFQVAGTDSAGSSVWSADSTFISDGSGGSGGGSGGGAGGGSGGSGGSGNTGGSGGGTGGSTNNNQQQNNNSQSNSTNVKPLSAYAPIISIDSKLSSVYKTPPTVAGSVKGAANITKIEYSIDNAKNWLPVDSSFGLNTLKATFTTTPINLKDGNYFVTIRAYDDTGNFSVLKSNTFVIDLIPPLVGTANVNIGAQTILPNTQGVYNLVAGTDTQITLNAVGGAINISLEAQKTGDTKTSYTFVMNHSSQTGLWTGIASFILPGEYTLQANAVDGANNSTSRTLGVVNVQNLGEVKDGSNNKPVRSVVSVYYLDPETNTMVLWDAGSSNQSNPLNTKDNGKYSFYLPAGTYYIKFESRGYKNVISDIFSLNKLTNVVSNVLLYKKPNLRMGNRSYTLPWVTFKQTKISLSAPGATTSKIQTIKNIPNFTLDLTNGKKLTTIDLYAKPTVLSFVSTWSDLGRDQIALLASVNSDDVNVVPVASGESLTKLRSFMSMGGYDVPLLVDINNQLVRDFNVSNVPTHYFINRRGVVTKVMSGVMTVEEIMNNVTK